MKLLTLISSLVFSISMIGQTTECDENHPLHIKGDTLYVWKHNSVNMVKTPDPNASVVTEIKFGEKLIVLEDINIASYYLEDQLKCYYDTLIMEPLIVIKSPFVKVKYGDSIGFILTHNLDKKNPRNYIKSEIRDTLYIEKECYESNYGWENYSKIISNNGEITFKYGMATYHFNPYINKNNYYHIASRMIEEYNKDRPGYTFSFSLNYYGTYTFVWRSKEEVGGDALEISFNDFGMIIRDYDFGC